MGEPFPKYPEDVLNGDEPTYAPTKSDHSLLAAERGTQHTKRLETDSDNNLFVNVAADTGSLSSTGVSALAVGGLTAVPASTTTTIVTYAAASTTRLTKISVSGTVYAKFQLFLNTVLIDTKRSGPERSLDFSFDIPLAIGVGDIIDVKVTHYNTALLEDFNSTIYGG